VHCVTGVGIDDADRRVLAMLGARGKTAAKTAVADDESKMNTSA
jgi:hypothetical protein